MFFDGGGEGPEGVCRELLPAIRPHPWINHQISSKLIENMAKNFVVASLIKDLSEWDRVKIIFIVCF